MRAILTCAFYDGLTAEQRAPVRCTPHKGALDAQGSGAPPVYLGLCYAFISDMTQSTFENDTLIVRLRPPSARKGAKLKSYTFMGSIRRPGSRGSERVAIRFLASKGWYSVPRVIADKLRDVVQDQNNPDSHPAFDVMTQDRALKVERFERMQAEQAAAKASAPMPVKIRLTDGAPGNRTTEQSPWDIPDVVDPRARSAEAPAIKTAVAPIIELEDLPDSDPASMDLSEVDAAEVEIPAPKPKKAKARKTRNRAKASRAP